ncbi:hypothetical protein FA13DRAFT_1725160 [Coprinellus micaceus]|uniref:Uncharacterized protein n=1 Tax=Coprinellus micaceus TaxID=71717 RepID=A0A4Y7TYD9_COPMI|nr:hypothetical protein FA13DRAFT_1725160 [Coprinellus micaceus]
MSNGVEPDERTPLIPTEDNVGTERNGLGDDPRLISDALTRIISAVSLEALASPLDYGYALTAVLYYRSQKMKEEESGVAPEKSSEGDVKLVERHVDVLWTQFLSQYRTDQEIDTVLWSEHRKDSSSGATLKAAHFLEGPTPYTALLTHPLVEAAVARRWKHGRHYTTSPPSSSLLQRADTLFGTPRNAHLLALASHLAYVSLLAHYLLYPPGRVSTDASTYYQDVHPHTTGLFVFALANALFVPTPYNYLYLTSLAALALPFPGLPQPGDGFFDILLFTFSLHILTLHRPFTSSLLYIHELSSSIPRVGFVHRSLVDGVAPSLFYFFLPFVASIVLLSLSLDGDLFRAAVIPFASLSSVIPAPMETRNTFLAIVLVILLGLFFSIFATTATVPTARTSQSTWDRYGTDLGYWARTVAVSVCSQYDPPYLYPPPFNLLRLVVVFPLHFLLKWSGQPSDLVKRVDQYVWRFTVLPFLLVAHLVSRVL